MSQLSSKLIWIDMEMSGLDPETDVILEIATVVTDNELTLVAKGPSLVLSQPAELFDKMDDWNQKHHTESGLWQKVQESTISLAEAEKTTLDFIRQHTEVGQSPLCGNSIHQDRRFICKYMPLIEAQLSYRIVDVSTVKELAARFGLLAKVKESFTKKNGHRAMDDILESIEELRFYRRHIFGLTDEATD